MWYHRPDSINSRTITRTFLQTKISNVPRPPNTRASIGGLDHEDWTQISYVPHRPSKPRSEMIKIKSNQIIGYQSRFPAAKNASLRFPSRFALSLVDLLVVYINGDTSSGWSLHNEAAQQLRERLIPTIESFLCAARWQRFCNSADNWGRGHPKHTAHAPVRSVGAAKAQV
jgi:hypothetical protein